MTMIQSNPEATAALRCPVESNPNNPTNASTSMQGGKAVFENDNYRITAGDNDSVNIENKNTGETYQVWSDPHMAVDGEHAFDFHGTTTLNLDDGTKVTLETTPSTSNPNETLPSRVTITSGNYGAQISGIDSNKAGDLKIDETDKWGSTLDAVVDDGNSVQENPAGKGFLAVDQDGKIRVVDQTYMDANDLKAGGKQLSPLERAFQTLASLLSIHLQGNFGGGQHPQPADPTTPQQPIHMQPYPYPNPGLQPIYYINIQAPPPNQNQQPAPAPGGMPPDPLDLFDDHSTPTDPLDLF